MGSRCSCASSSSPRQLIARDGSTDDGYTSLGDVRAPPSRTEGSWACALRDALRHEALEFDLELHVLISAAQAGVRPVSLDEERARDDGARERWGRLAEVRKGGAADGVAVSGDGNGDGMWRVRMIER